jgi:hypothetical protein
MSYLACLPGGTNPENAAPDRKKGGVGEDGAIGIAVQD